MKEYLLFEFEHYAGTSGPVKDQVKAATSTSLSFRLHTTGAGWVPDSSSPLIPELEEPLSLILPDIQGSVSSSVGT